MSSKFRDKTQIPQKRSVGASVWVRTCEREGKRARESMWVREKVCVWLRVCVSESVCEWAYEREIKR